MNRDAVSANARVSADRESRRVDVQDLVVTEAYVDEGPTLKRFRPRAQGRAYRIRKRTSHITIEVESRPKKAEPAKKATKKAAKPAKSEKASQKEGA